MHHKMHYSSSEDSLVSYSGSTSASHSPGNHTRVLACSFSANCLMARMSWQTKTRSWTLMGLSLFLRLLWMQSTATERSGFQTVFCCFETVLKQLKEINNPHPDGSPRIFWIRTALTDRQKLTDLCPAQQGSVFKIKLNIFWILSSRKYIF